MGKWSYQTFQESQATKQSNSIVYALYYVKKPFTYIRLYLSPSQTIHINTIVGFRQNKQPARDEGDEYEDAVNVEIVVGNVKGGEPDLKEAQDFSQNWIPHHK